MHVLNSICTTLISHDLKHEDIHNTSPLLIQKQVSRQANEDGTKARLGALCERVLNGHLIEHPGDVPPAAARSVDGDNG